MNPAEPRAVPHPEPPAAAAPTAIPERFCDIIMKGGITSGVVYPAAVCELARSYRFKSIGGTSAGAIAAVLTAAAELGRGKTGSGFDPLAKLPDELARNLLSLFQPNRFTRPAFSVLLAGLGPQPWWRKVPRLLFTLFLRHWPWSLAGLLMGWGLDRWLLTVLQAHPSPSAGRWLGGLLIGISTCSAVALGFSVTAYLGLAANNFGLCSGFAPPGKRPPPLTTWLADRIDETAGRTDPTRPLTFGDLWGLPAAASDSEKKDRLDHPERREINLEVMTTNLMHSRPYRIPFRDQLFFYKREDFARLFPARIVDWMVGHSAPAKHPANQAQGLLHLPPPADLPVVVAARLSLSFPFLLSAVPLYAVDFRRPGNQKAAKEGQALLYERCWFSDGGIGSNFPIHFFDGLLPGRPTFGINLRPFPPNDDGTEVEQAPPNPGDCVQFPQVPQGEVRPAWNRFRGLRGFPGAIVETMQNWVDSTQMRLPGYRDRVVHILLTSSEGGMNLNMDVARVLALSARGRQAGEILTQDFNWDLHRWTRFRTALAQFQQAFAKAAQVYDGKPEQEESFAAFLDRYAAQPKNYPLKHPELARPAVEALFAVAKGWQDQGIDFVDGEPRPEPDLRIVPRI